MKSLWTLVLACVLFAACSDTDDSYDGYANWKARNAEWFALVLDSARTDIAAKGDQSVWRIRRTVLKTDASGGNDSNYVVMKRVGLTEKVGQLSPTYTDTVCLAYRGWLMERMDYVYSDTELTPIKTVFAQTFFGKFDPKTAGIVEAPVSDYVEGFSTALQYMKSGEMWMIYIPQGMAYGAEAGTVVPAYSTLQFFVWMQSWRRSGIPGDM
jgi:FKBP-type peptidyl-prolyl cis-trans isomerase FklB